MTKSIKMNTLKNTTFDELLDIIDGCDNVKSIFYDKEFKEFTIHYKNGLAPDTVGPEELIDFLQNA